MKLLKIEKLEVKIEKLEAVEVADNIRIQITIEEIDNYCDQSVLLDPLDKITLSQFRTNLERRKKK